MSIGWGAMQLAEGEPPTVTGETACQHGCRGGWLITLRWQLILQAVGTVPFGTGVWMLDILQTRRCCDWDPDLPEMGVDPLSTGEDDLDAAKAFAERIVPKIRRGAPGYREDLYRERSQNL